MPHKRASSDAALDKSVEILRDGLGRVAKDTFVMAPLWVPGVGCLGLVTFADLPYVRTGATNTRTRKKRRRRQPTAESSIRGSSGVPSGGIYERHSESSSCPYAVGGRFIDFAKRVGVTLGAAVHRIRCRALLQAIAADRGKVVAHGDHGDMLKENPSMLSLLQPKKGSPVDTGEVVPRTTNVLLWPTNFEVSICIFAAVELTEHNGVQHVWIFQVCGISFSGRL